MGKTSRGDGSVLENASLVWSKDLYWLSHVLGMLLLRSFVVMLLWVLQLLALEFLTPFVLSRLT